MSSHPFDVIAFDADDTLWHSEDGFRECELRFVELVGPHTAPGIDVAAALVATERANLSALGYGVKSFAMSMVECAVTITDGTIPSATVAALVRMAKDLLTAPVRMLPHVPEVLAEVGATHRVVLITKGDLVHQTHKVTTSGLAHHFEHVEIVLEKDPATYARILERIGVIPERFCMVGNSVRSDILPVMALGGTGVHIPYPLLWELEHVEHDEHFVELGSLAEFPAWLRAARSATQ
jgi:putative hydrolase of the HAD superfamily